MRKYAVEVNITLPDGEPLPFVQFTIGGAGGPAAAPATPSGDTREAELVAIEREALDVRGARPGGPRGLTPSELAPWKASPEARNRMFPAAADEGQHDTWKRELAIVLWRVLAGSSVPYARGWFDLDGDVPAPGPALWPLHSDLTQACRRLGLGRLVHAALGFTEGDGGRASSVAEAPAGGAFRLLAGGRLPDGTELPVVREALDAAALASLIAREHAAASEQVIMRAVEQHARQREEWSGPGEYVGMSEAEYTRLYALAPDASGARPDLHGCPPLSPLRLSWDARSVQGATPPRRTPATGAVLPTPDASAGAPAPTPATGAVLPPPADSLPVAPPPVPLPE